MTLLRRLLERYSSMTSRLMRPNSAIGKKTTPGLVPTTASSPARRSIPLLLSSSICFVIATRPAQSYEPRQPPQRSELHASALPGPCRQILSPLEWHRGHDFRGEIL